MAIKFVAFLDILGFKDLVTNNTADQLAELYTASLNDVKEKLDQLKLNKNEKYPDVDIQSLLISDSIVFWADDTFNNFCHILLSVYFFMYAMFHRGLPLRGVITYDELVELDFSLFKNQSTVLLGKSITNAYLLESAQNWSGCMVTNQAIERFSMLSSHKDENTLTLTDMLKHNMIGKYPVPFKTGKIEDFYAVLWSSSRGESVVNEAEIRNSFAKHGKDTNNWDVEIKIRNTIDFVNFFNSKFK